MPKKNFRDMVGYGSKGVKVVWPNNARIAVQIVLNYEEGAENCVLNGDNNSEVFLSEIIGAKPVNGRHISMESLYEYGSRAGFWRLHRLFQEKKIPITIFGVGMALEKNPEICRAIKDAGYEVASHGWRWIDYQNVKKSEENKVFSAYVKYINSERTIANQLVEQRKAFAVNSPDYKVFTEKINQKTANVINYQKDIVANHWDKLVSRIVKLSMDVVIPEAPISEAEITVDPNLRFLYFRQHYFDNIDLQDDRLVRTPIYHKKLENYFSESMMIQHWDTVLHYAFDLCDQLNPKSELFQYTVSWITSSYEKSKIMGMDKVFVMMGDRYYCARNAEGNALAFWMKEEKLKTLCEKVNTQKNLVMGAIAPNISLRDTSDVTWKDFYSLQSEYKILYFWDPNCGHCKKITPKLQVLYERKFRDRNVEIFAVGKAIGDEFEKWKNYVKKNNLEFINVAVTDKLFKAATEDAGQFVPKHTTLEALNYQQTYDIYATPKVFVLDQKNKIIAKSLSVSQLEDLKKPAVG